MSLRGRRGNAREVLLVHGIGQRPRAIFRHIAWLPEVFHVVAVDLPVSELPTGRMCSIHPATTRVSQALAAVSCTGLRAGGHSMGAWCRCATPAYPDDVLRLAVVDARGAA